MTKSTHTIGTDQNHVKLNQFNGAAIIDEFGNETPITEAMIQHACNALRDSWRAPSVNPQTPGISARAM